MNQDYLIQFMPWWFQFNNFIFHIVNRKFSLSCFMIYLWRDDDINHAYCQISLIFLREISRCHSTWRHNSCMYIYIYFYFILFIFMSHIYLLLFLLLTEGNSGHESQSFLIYGSYFFHNTHGRGKIF